MNRRQFLSSLASGATALSLAGCSSSDEPADSFRETYTVDEDAWQGREFTYEDDGRFEYEAVVRDGPAVDFLVMKKPEYQHYQNGERFEYVTAISSLDTIEAELSEELPEGNYAFVVDHTTAAAASPPTDGVDNVAKVEVDAKIFA